MNQTATINNFSVSGMVNDDIEAQDIRELVSPQEWEARVNLAACYRLLDIYGMTDMIYNHVTARVPGEPQHFLINAYGEHYSEIKASTLHKIDHEGNIVTRGNTHYGINYPGFVIHSAVHMARPDLNCVIHSHTRAGVAVSSMKCGLLPLGLLAMRFQGQIAYHDCEGTVVSIDERERIAQDLGDKNIMILRNHGLLACAGTIAEAFNLHYMLDTSCKIQIDAMSSGAELVMPPPEVVEETARLFQPNVRRAYGVMEWEAMRRLVDRRNPGYQD